MMNPPKTQSEWQTYIEELPPSAVWSQAVAANTHTFCRRIVEEGQRMEDAEGIVTLFALRLKALGMKFPQGGAFDLANLVLTEDHPPFAENEVAFLETAAKTPPVLDDEMAFAGDAEHG